MPLELDGPLAQEMMKREMKATPSPSTPTEKEGVGKLAPLVYGLGGGADVASTLYGFKHGMKEANPLVNWAPQSAQVPLGVGMELAGVLLAKKLLGNKHPKLMKGILMGLGGVHGGLAARNMALTSQSNPSQPDIPAPEATEYMNPDYFGK